MAKACNSREMESPAIGTPRPDASTRGSRRARAITDSYAAFSSSPVTSIKRVVLHNCSASDGQLSIMDSGLENDKLIECCLMRFDILPLFLVLSKIPRISMYLENLGILGGLDG